MNGSIFQLTTNEGKEYVRSTDKRLREAMYKYIRGKREKGIPLSAILFTWVPVNVSRSI